MTSSRWKICFQLAALALLAGSGCKKKDDAPPVQGRVSNQKLLTGEQVVGKAGTRIVEGVATDLRVTSTGAHALFLLEAEKPRLDGIPPQMRLGVLNAVSTKGDSPPRRLGNGVTNVPGGYLTSADGTWVLFLTGYNTTEQSGELKAAKLTDPASEVVRLGGRVTYMVLSPDSTHVAFVDDGALRMGPLPAGPFKELASEVATAEFSPDGSFVLFRRRLALGGGLYQALVNDGGKPPKKLADQVGDYKLTPDGKTIAYAARPTAGSPNYDLFVADTATLKSKSLAQNIAIVFRFSPDGKRLAHNEGLSPEDPGDLFVSAFDGSSPKKLGDKVKDFQFSPDSKSLALREHYSDNEGDLSVITLESGDTVRIGRRSRSYSWSDDSKLLAFTLRVTRPLVSVDLWIYRLGDQPRAMADGGLSTTPAVFVKQWVYDYDFTPQGDRLLFRSDCIREGRACDLYSITLADLTAAPVRLVESMHGFKISKDGQRVLLTYARAQQGDFFDVGVLNLKKNDRRTVEQFVKLPALWLADDGSRVAYSVGEQGRAGVYVASEVP